MNVEELKIWFWDLYESCYPVVHEDYENSIFLFYDENFIRNKKLCRILGNDEIKYPEKVVGDCLFEQDEKNKKLWIDYYKIWSIFESNYSNNYDNIKELISGWMKETDKLRVLTPQMLLKSYLKKMKETDKLRVLTPPASMSPLLHPMKETDKLRVLTPYITWFKCY